MAGQAGDRLAVHDDVARRRRVEAAHAVEHGGLAGPVGADDGENLVGFDFERHAVDGQQAAEPHAPRGDASWATTPADATSSSTPSPDRTSASGTRRIRAPVQAGPSAARPPGSRPPASPCRPAPPCTGSRSIPSARSSQG
ncbi:hypothetical protein G6F24_016246 [Rhizopus arrhizus]|nr:hypothetical protein G6F24_016246 [Rhizopus arrhizus]